MGIPNYFRTILSEFPDTCFWSPDVKTDCFFMDYNCLIYYCLSKFVEKEKQNLESMSDLKLDNGIIKECVNYTQSILRLVNPEIAVICLDGPAPKAKIVQQRYRRFKKIVESEMMEKLKQKHGLSHKVSWDTNQITPGTKFMYKLCKKLSSELKKGVKNTRLKKIVFSDVNHPGEGEQKIVEYIRTHRITGDICIYGLDADLIILSLVLMAENGRRQIRLLRETEISGNDIRHVVIDSPFMYLSIGKFLQALIAKHPQLQHRNLQNTIYDYIFLTFFAGNDFVKGVPFLSIRDRGLDLLLNIYTECIKKAGGSTFLVTISKHGPAKINKPILEAIIQGLAEVEDISMRRYQSRINHYRPKQDSEFVNKTPFEMEKMYFEHEPYYSTKHPEYHKHKELFKTINYNCYNNVWKDQYYTHFFGFDNSDPDEYNRYRRKVCTAYMKSLMWTLEYYTNPTENWTWYYPYPVAPFPSDLEKSLRHMDFDRLSEFEKTKGYRPFEQLFFVLPIQPNDTEGEKMLPKGFIELMHSRKFNLFFPTKFDLDILHGGKYIYSDPKIPIIPDSLVIDELRKIKLKPSEQQRNVVKSKLTVYCFE